MLKKSGVDSDSLEVRKPEDRRIRVSGLRKSKIWSVYTSGAAEFSEWFILRIWSKNRNLVGSGHRICGNFLELSPKKTSKNENLL